MYIILIMVLVAAVIALIYGKSVKQPAKQPAAQISKIFLTYVMFIHLVALNKKAIEAEARGELGEEFRSSYMNLIPLSACQAETLSRIAEECINEINEETPKAKKITQIVSEARERLRTHLGEADFARLDRFIDERFGPAVQRSVSSLQFPVSSSQ